MCSVRCDEGGCETFKCKPFEIGLCRGLLKMSESCFCRKLWCVLFTGCIKVGLLRLKLLVLLLLWEGNLNCSLQKKEK